MELLRGFYYWNCLGTCMYYKPQCLLFSYDQTMTIFKKKISFSFLHWNISSFVHFIIFCRSKYGFRAKLFLHVRFLSQAQKLFLYIVFCFKLCVLKKVLNTEINGKSDILVDHEFHMVSFSLSIKEWDVSVAMYMYII